MKGFIGSANVDTNSRLCMSSSVAGHKRAFGADIVPGTYRDLDEADLIVLVGSNAAWCHPVLFQRMVAARRERGTKLVVIDPRRTATADEADLFLPIAPGMDTALFCGLLSHLADTRALNYTYIERHTKGFVEALARAQRDCRRRCGHGAGGRAQRVRCRSVLQTVRQDRTRRHLLLARRQSVRAGHRQGQRHHQCAPGDRPHRPRRHGTVLAHGTAQRDGRTRSRRPRQSARRAYGLFSRRARPRPPLLECTASCRGRRSQGDRHVRRHRSRRQSRRCG